MNLRSEIREIIRLDEEPSLASWKILLLLDEKGFSIFGNGFLENSEDYDPGCNYFGITDIILNELDTNLASMKVISKLEDIGLGLTGNGWLDDDPEVIDYLDTESDGDNG